MIVDNGRKVIYLHNPKCGGTFLRDIYIEKYGESEATKWWKIYDSRYGTDLGHITYSDLYRFIPDWKDYRIVMMVRNPYSRFYSAVKEVKLHLIGFIKLGFIEIPYARIDKNGIESRIKNTFFRSICPGTYNHTLVKLFTVSPEYCCKQILSFERPKQDLFIRSKKIPWLNPQSYFWGKDVEVLYYESETDWEKLLDIFDLSEYLTRLSIAKAYEIPDYMYAMIEELYPEDMELFRKYKTS
ncbi:hypothetical protein [uncultured Parabacteroides sp.]|jgi:hypothetical protein|uniref:hypothetical protein n=1 Tax=uncultured Parabacteroides sp. TaxID=512312 RepID=UPI0025FA417B|nr:hypothetical protein [uncultured Parabacteroides sp.]